MTENKMNNQQDLTHEEFISELDQRGMKIEGDMVDSPYVQTGYGSYNRFNVGTNRRDQLDELIKMQAFLKKNPSFKSTS